MASATESDVRAQLPNDIEGQPSSAEITDKLSDATDKVASYEDLTDAEIKKGEKYWAAYLLLDLKYQKPESISEAGIDAEYDSSLTERLKKKFLNTVGASHLRVV